MRTTVVLSIALAVVAGVVRGSPTAAPSPTTAAPAPSPTTAAPAPSPTTAPTPTTAAPSPTPTCESTDDTVDGTLFKPLREKIQSSKSDYIAFSDFHIDMMGFGVEYSAATAGNFSSLQLTPPSKDKPSSELCTEIDSDKTVETFNINLGFDDLEAKFGSFVVKTPILNLGGSSAAIKLSGENLRVSLTTTTDKATNQCTVDLKDFTFTNWGTLQIKLGGGAIDWVLEKIFNNYVNGYVLNLLTEFGVGSTINNFVTSYAARLISETGQEQTVCELIGLLKK